MIISALKFRTLPATRRSDREILVVAFRSASTLQARMAVVRGASEWQRVMESGKAVREAIARELFPEFRGIAYGGGA